MDSSTRPAAAIVPLQREPHRIRPPFDVAVPGPTDGHRFGETAAEWQTRCQVDRVKALLEPLDGIELGAYDHSIIEWLATWDTSVIGTVASLFYRARMLPLGGAQ
jgi:hypothetical protein